MHLVTSPLHIPQLLKRDIIFLWRGNWGTLCNSRYGTEIHVLPDSITFLLKVSCKVLLSTLSVSTGRLSCFSQCAEDTRVAAEELACAFLEMASC